MTLHFRGAAFLPRLSLNDVLNADLLSFCGVEILTVVFALSFVS